MRSWLSCVVSLCFAAGCCESPAEPGSGGAGGEQSGGGGAAETDGGRAAGAGARQSAAWARSFGGSGRDFGQSIAIDEHGNIYVGGFFEKEASFGAVTLEAPAVGGFVVKLSPAGAVLWATAIPSTGEVNVHDLAIGAGGNLYLCGSYTGAATFGKETAAAQGSRDGFVASLNEAGAFRWFLDTGASLYAQVLGVAMDGAGTIRVAGYFAGEAQIGGTPLTTPEQDAFVAALDDAGSVLHVTTAGGMGSAEAHAIAARPDGATLIAGSFYALPGETMQAGPYTLTTQGGNDALVLFLDAGGEITSASLFGGPSWEEAWGVAIDEAGAGYVAGRFDIESTFGDTTLKSPGLGLFAAGFDTSGDLAWVTAGGGPSEVTAISLLPDDKGRTFMTGLFSGKASFGDSTLVGPGLWDLYVARAGSSGFDWAIGGGGTGNDYGTALARSPSGELVVTGFFEGSAKFGDIAVKAAGDNDVLVWTLRPDP